MNQSEQQPQTIPAESEAQLRTWVTPTFEQVALKDALSGTISVGANDGTTDSS